MECLLPIAFRSLPEFVWNPIAEICHLFKNMCCNTLKMDHVMRMEQNIPFTICKLEKNFPIGFFDSMEHLVIYLPMEVILGGPVQYPWMYPFQKVIKIFIFMDLISVSTPFCSVFQFLKV